MSELDQLPDYPALRDVLRALWGQSEVRGAALMVGAGFSRLATPASANTIPLPLWSHFAQRMAAELYPADQSRAPYDPLRLAEEYRAALGSPALENLIRELVPDKKWNPSDHHRRLVSLPWSDILTTNWDTLLERAAASDPDRRYEHVVAPQDVARTRAPRIVKLHGSLPANPPFIFTQEDYRTYPARFAPFVNLAQQVLLENELCLVGFSGNDPNFLQWTGWVRDQLGNSARPIRLIGVLDLQPSQRALLAEQNITPIDLAPLVEEFSGAERHREAMTRLIEVFEKAKPAAPGKWHRETDRKSFGDDFTVNGLLTLLERDRSTYPGWLLVPTHERHRLRRESEDVIRSVEPLLDQFDQAQRQRFAFEAAWLVERSGWMHPAQLHDLYRETLSSGKPEISRSELHFLAIALARVARSTLDEVAFDGSLTRATELAISADELAATAYERCLWHRDRIEHAGIEANLHRVKGDDPIWTMRRAALLADLKRDREAAQLVRQAALEIRSRRAQDPHSLWLLSREAWVHFFWREARFELSRADGEFEKIDGLSGFDDWPLRYTEHKCDPWEELRDFDTMLDDEIADRAKRIRRDTPRFDAGTWKREGTGRVTYNYSRVSPWNMLGYLIDTIGIVRSANFNTVETRLERAGEFLGNETLPDWLARIRAVRRREDGFVETAFGRIAIARLNAHLAVELFEKLKTAIDYGRKRLWRDERHDDGEQRSSGWVEEVRIYLELVSRVVVRLDPDAAISAFRWGCSIGTDGDFTHWWLFKPLSHLLDRCLDAIPPARHGELALDMVRFPVVDSDRDGMLRDWPNFANRLAGIPSISREGSGWEEAIARAIEAARDLNPEVRTRGILMILPLYRLGLLKPSETEAFGHAVWSRRDGPGLPEAHYLISSGFLDGPPPHDGSIGEAFQASVIRPLAGGTLTDETLISLARASNSHIAAVAPLSEADAIAILEHIADWPVPQQREWDRDYHMQEDRNKRIAAGEALARAVLPALRNAQLSPTIRDALMTSSVPDRAPELMQGLPEIALREPNICPAIVERISLALASTNTDLARSAIGAIISWSQLATETATGFPSALATELAACCLARRPASLYGALHAAVQLVRADHFSQADIAKLVAALELLWIETDYANVDAGDAIAVTLTLVRCECVRLAATLADRGTEIPVILLWRELVESDPMPEVRFALETE